MAYDQDKLFSEEQFEDDRPDGVAMDIIRILVLLAVLGAFSFGVAFWATVFGG